MSTVSSSCWKLLLITSFFDKIALLCENCYTCCFKRHSRGYIFSKVLQLNKLRRFISVGNCWLCKNSCNCRITITRRELMKTSTKNNTPPTHTKPTKESQTKHESHPLGWPSRGLSIKKWFLKCICQVFYPETRSITLESLVYTYLISGGLTIKESNQTLSFGEYMFLIRN